MAGAGLLRSRFETGRDKVALVWRDRRYSYRWLLERSDVWGRRLAARGVEPGTAVALAIDLAPEPLALLLALLERRAIVVLAAGGRRAAGSGTAGSPAAVSAGAEFLIDVSGPGAPRFERLEPGARHEHYRTLRRRGHPGLVLFTSGSSGRSKAVVHDFERLAAKFERPGKDLKTLSFFPLDHIGGLDTVLYCLAAASTIVIPDERSPDALCRLVERHRIEVLPVSPSWLNLLSVSGAAARYDLSSLSYVTYGAEVMSERTLERAAAIFGHARLVQKYGATEFGALRSRSRGSDSRWLRLDGERVETRVVDGELEIRAPSAMLGYLDAPARLSADGWLRTGDAVEVDGDYVRILGRRSDVINVGGGKVYPAEVEAVIQELSNVVEAAVAGEGNALLGAIVAARVRLAEDEEPAAFRARLKAHCRARLEPYKVPVRITLGRGPLHDDRGKKKRARRAEEG